MINKFFNRLFSGIKAIPADLQSSYYPSLDGLRGIAIIMVVVSHLNLTSGFYYNMVFNGELGVLIFFVLSGFLITTLCIKEKVITHAISLKSFYVRRVLRIFPVAYLFILVIIVLNYFFKLHIGYISILGAALYLMNISSFFRTHEFSWFTGHFWSLAVEEQFYLIVPFLLKTNYKVYLSALLFIAFVLPVFIYLQYQYAPLNNIVFYAFTHYLIKFQAIAVGCLYAVFLFNFPKKNTFIIKYKLLTNLAAIALILYIRYENFLNLKNMFSGLAISLMIGYVIITNIAPAKDIIFKLLNLKMLKIVGVLSYSIYIWQQIFTSGDKRLPAFMVIYPYNIVCIIVASCVSYYFYENFFLKLKSKYSKIKSRPAVVLST